MIDYDNDIRCVIYKRQSNPPICEVSQMGGFVYRLIAENSGMIMDYWTSML